MFTNSKKAMSTLVVGPDPRVWRAQVDEPRSQSLTCVGNISRNNEDRKKCTEICNAELEYAMNTIDTAYIRTQCRHQGLGMEILYDVLTRYRNLDIGFSKPISHGILRVIKLFLRKHKEYRLHFWEIKDGGTEESTKLIWFTLKKQ